MKYRMRLKMAAALGCGVAALLAGCKREAPATAGKGGPASAAAMAAQVVAVEARVQPVVETLSLVGTLLANEMVEMKSEIEGRVASIHFEEGQRVAKDHLLVQLDDRELAAALAEAEAALKISQITYGRSQQLFQEKLISQQEYDQSSSLFQGNRSTVERRQSILRYTRIKAPFDGIVGRREVSPGQVISKNTMITWLVDLDTLKAEFAVPERFLSQVQPGQRLQLNVAAYPETPFPGTVYFVAPQVDAQTRTVLVRARVSNPEAKLKPGMFANLDLALQVRENAIVVPEAALVPSGERTMVLLVDKSETVMIQPVKVGLRMAGEAEITGGLKGGELVIVEGVQKARPGGKVVLAPPEASAPYQKRAPRKQSDRTAG